jgi:tryptophan halogenase
LDKPWIKNVCAIGLSANFVEPLEASSIGTSINQSFILANRIIHYNQDVIDRYNKEVDAIMNNIRDFIILHYISPRRDTEFWRSVAEVELPDTLKANLNMWKHRLPIIDDFTSYTKKVLFNEYNHTLVMYGMGLFDQEKIMAQYDSVPQEAKHYTERQIQTKLDYDKVKTIPHKMMLDLIRRLS